MADRKTMAQVLRSLPPLASGNLPGESQADKWARWEELNRQAAAQAQAQAAQGIPAAPSSQDMGMNFALQQAKGFPGVQSAPYSSWGGPNKPLSEMTSADLVAASHHTPQTNGPDVAGIGGIEDTRRFMNMAQTLGATGDYNRNPADTYTRGKTPDAVVEPGAVRSALAGRLVKANSMAQAWELIKQLYANETGPTPPPQMANR